MSESRRANWRSRSRRVLEHLDRWSALRELPSARADGSRGGATDDLTRVLRDVVSAGGDRTGAVDVPRLLAAVVEAGLSDHCELLTWDEEWEPGTDLILAQRKWSAEGPLAPVMTGPPTPEDVLVRFRGCVLGFLRTDPSPTLHHRGTLDVVARALALLLDQERSARRALQLRQEAVRAQDELADRRQRAAAGMDLTRRELERDLHDGVQGDLVALRMRVNLLHLSLSAGTAPGVELPTTHDLLDEARRLRERFTSTAAGLAPRELSGNGLGAALRGDLPGEGVGSLVLDLDNDLEERRYPPAIEAAVYFVCAEAVVNARKHAPGSDVSVSVHPSYRGLDVLVRDTGPGFDGPAPPGAFRAMRARVDAVEGTLIVESTRARGTRVEVSIPW